MLCWERAWSQPGRCMWNDSTAPCGIGSGALTRKTHAFAKRDATFDALLGLQLFDHNFRRAHPALRLPARGGPASLSPPLSGHGTGADRASLVVPRTVDDLPSYRPFLGSLPTRERTDQGFAVYPHRCSPSEVNDFLSCCNSDRRALQNRDSLQMCYDMLHHGLFTAK